MKYRRDRKHWEWTVGRVQVDRWCIDRALCGRAGIGPHPLRIFLTRKP